MKKLTDIIEGLEILKSIGILDHIYVNSIVFDSRTVVPDALFVATRGTQVDGHKYIDTAIEMGAKAIICERIPEVRLEEVIYIEVRNSQYALGKMASNFYDRPSEKLQVIGITGTNGKTSCATMLFNLFTGLGYKVGLLSTIQIRIGEENIQATHTTPDSVSIQKSMQYMVEKGCSYCFMEVSSHAIDQDRIAGIQFRGGIFTNITHDHLDYHLTFQNYLQAKKKFFDNLPNTAFTISNIDDKNGKVMQQNTKAKRKTMAIHNMADYTIKIMEASMKHMLVKIGDHDIHLKVVGEFNAYNALTSYAVAIELGINKEDALLQLSNLEPIEGRIDLVLVKNTKVKGIVDYAHTPDAVEKLLVEIGKINKEGKLITVIGCGGNRDKEKRPIMAKLAAKYSDRVILTSDNPRNENPKDIIDEMKSGLNINDIKKTLVVIDRAEAVKTACLLASGEDVIVLVGKGHEKYQEIKGEKFPFDDKLCLKENLELITEE
jgi:UDP-N-acetylmuramoyl-L-alanyl-D-glutamate--2,6-diaminopimelate ligase